ADLHRARPRHHLPSPRTTPSSRGVRRGRDAARARRRPPRRRRHRPRGLPGARGRLDGHRPDAHPGEGVGDPAVRVRGQADPHRLGVRGRAAARRRRRHHRREPPRRRSAHAGRAGRHRRRAGRAPARGRSSGPPTCPGRRTGRCHDVVVPAPARGQGDRRAVRWDGRSDAARGRAGGGRPRRGRSGSGSSRTLGDVVPPQRDRCHAARRRRPRACVPEGSRGAVRRHHQAPHPQRRLLPGRHPAVPAGGGRRELVADHRRRRRQGGHADLRRPGRHAARRARHHAHLRVQRGRREARRRGALARRTPQGRARPRGHRLHQGRPDPLDRRRGHDDLDAARGRSRRPGLAHRHRHERRAAAARARLPGAHGRPRPLRVRERVQVDHQDDADDVRRRAGLLDRARLGGRRADQGLEPHRHPQAALRVAGREGHHRRDRLGPDRRHREGRGPHRRQGLAGGQARPRGRQGLLAPVVPRVGRRAGPALRGLPSHHQGRHRADRGQGGPVPRGLQRAAGDRRHHHL
ncbi:MAG: probable sulfite oxidase, partial [uncultured Nocardioides sp.]